MDLSYNISLAKPLVRIITRIASISSRINGQSALSLTDVRSLLCVELTRMGDVISMLPALQLLKKALPKARLSVVVDDRYKPLFRFVHAVDEAFGYANTTTVIGLLGAATESRRSHYDLICSMSPSYRNAFVTAFVRAKAKVGYFVAHDSLTPFLNPAKIDGRGIHPLIPLEYDRENIYERSIKICQALGISLIGQQNFLQIPDSDLLALQTRLSKRGFNISTPYVVIHPFAGWKFRYWKSEEAVAFINKMLEIGKQVVLIGEEKESKLGENICSMTKDSKHMWKAFGLPLDELVVLLKHAEIFVGTDSGPLHLATALGIPVVGLYGPAHPKFTAPPGLSNSYLFKQVECSPCDQRKCVRPKNPCMHLISAEEVYEKIT